MGPHIIDNHHHGEHRVLVTKPFLVCTRLHHGILVSSEIGRAGIGAGNSEDGFEIVVTALERWENGRAVDWGQKCIGTSGGEVLGKGSVSEYSEGGCGNELETEGKQQAKERERRNLNQRARAIAPIEGVEFHDAME